MLFILRITARAVLGLAISLAALSAARAACGPENVLLVVNPQSPDSLCIANHYASLRHIPAKNFLFLDWDPKQEDTDINTFRDKILGPVLRAAMLPIPGRRIDYVVYSSDFPWSIRIDDDIDKFKAALEKLEREKKPEPGKDEKSSAKPPAWLTYDTPVAAINGLTFLYEPVMVGGFYIHPQSNWYARTGVPEQAKAPTLAFSGLTAYGPHGEVVSNPGSSPGRHYLLSMMLGVTAGRGNSVDEVLSYLKRSAAADGTHPRGTIYYMQNSDIRSKVRQRGFPDAVQKLKALGVAAEILEGTVPRDKKDVQGAMMGMADFNWQASGSTILPGAICEHFTSYGGDLHKGANQTPLSELLRYGATAASGTVTEPYALAQKFPAPMMQVHYARGCTVAESFYQSIECPYQLLIVGDPLCRPWANIPQVTLSGLPASGPVHGEVRLKPQARFAGGVEADHFEMFLDGGLFRDCPPNGSFAFDSEEIADGTHEIRVAAVSKGAVPAWGEMIASFSSSNRDRTIAASCTPEKTVSLSKSLLVKASAPHSTLIQVIQGTRLLGTITGADGKLEIPAKTLGLGPVQIIVSGDGYGGPKTTVVAAPLEVVVVP